MLEHCDTVSILIVKSLSCFDLFELVSTGKKKRHFVFSGRRSCLLTVITDFFIPRLCVGRAC